MPRIAGVDIRENKRVDIGLTGIYGVGRANVGLVLAQAKVPAEKRVGDLTEEEITRLHKAIDANLKVEGGLRREIQANLKRLRQIGSYRGRRHALGLPVRGQRTRSNARTKRGRRMTIGALRKEDLLKKQQAETEKAKASVGK